MPVPYSDFLWQSVWQVPILTTVPVNLRTEYWCYCNTKQDSGRLSCTVPQLLYVRYTAHTGRFLSEIYRDGTATTSKPSSQELNPMRIAENSHQHSRMRYGDEAYEYGSVRFKKLRWLPSPASDLHHRERPFSCEFPPYPPFEIKTYRRSLIRLIRLINTRRSYFRRITPKHHTRYGPNHKIPNYAT